jgi:hypothetical protein
LATSYLIFAGRYQPTYSARAAELRSLLAEIGHLEPWPAHGRGLVQRISACTETKITGNHLAANHNSDFLHEAITSARQLWLWEALQLSSWVQPAPLPSLIAALGRRQSVSDRLRGWASFLRRVPRNNFHRNRLRWTKLFWLASPRYLTYASAFELFCQIPHLLPPAQSLEPASSLDLVRRWLPVLPAGPTETWSALAGGTIDCYRNFLLGTSS